MRLVNCLYIEAFSSCFSSVSVLFIVPTSLFFLQSYHSCGDNNNLIRLLEQQKSLLRDNILNHKIPPETLFSTQNHIQSNLYKWILSYCITLNTAYIFEKAPINHHCSMWLSAYFANFIMHTKTAKVCRYITHSWRKTNN